MQITDWKMVNGGTCREWRCCGLVWQMIVVPAWEGTFANFVCPVCGDWMPWSGPELSIDFAW